MPIGRASQSKLAIEIKLLWPAGCMIGVHEQLGIQTFPAASASCDSRVCSSEQIACGEERVDSVMTNWWSIFGICWHASWTLDMHMIWHGVRREMATFIVEVGGTSQALFARQETKQRYSVYCYDTWHLLQKNYVLRTHGAAHCPS